MSLPRRLIITADDLGVSAGVNEAIVRAAHQGLVTSASVLVTGPAAADGVRAARGICLGLHLAFAQARCAADPATLLGLATSTGDLPPSVFHLLRRRLEPEVLRLEAEAQLARFQELAGTLPAFVNTHQHAQLLPAVRDVLVALCVAHGIERVRCPVEQRPIPRARLRSWLWPAATAIGLAARPRLRRVGLRFPDRMLGGPVSGRLTPTHLRRLLQAVRGGTTELVVHPRPGSPELAALLDPAAKDLLRRAWVERIPFDVL